MTVYVESNFVLELALQQEQCDSCLRIVGLATEQRITVAIPAFSLAEPYQTIRDKGRTRAKLGEDLRRQLSELGRSKPHRELPANFDALAAVLATSAASEHHGLRSAISELLGSAEVIPLDYEIMRAALSFEAMYDLSGQDAIVLASVLSHLSQYEPRESCFLNRNSKDFDDPDIREKFDRLGCKLIWRFDDGLLHIISRTDA